MIGSVFKALGRREMDVSLTSGRQLRVRIVERPGRWMTAAALDDFCADLRRVAARTLPEGDLSYGVFAADRAVMSDTIVTLVKRRDGTPVGFNALVVMELPTQPEPTEVLHLGLVMVDPAERSRDLSWVLYGLTCFLIFLRRRFRPLWVSNVTQVPAVVGMVAGMFSAVWPQPDPRARRSLDHLLLARQIMQTHRHAFGVGPEAGFDEDRFVITDAYTGGSDALKKTYAETSKHRDPAFNSFCAAHLDYARGDDLIQLGRMDTAAFRTYLTRDVPRGARLRLLLIGAALSVQRLALPVMHWADASQTWSILRPARGRSS